MEHLTQDELKQRDRDILTALQPWLSQAAFKEDQEGVETCVDQHLEEKWDLLLGMDVVQAV